MRKLLPHSILCLCLLALLAGCQPDPGAQYTEHGLPEGFEEKTPALPAAFVDTSGGTYAWHKSYNRVQSIGNRIRPPQGYARTEVQVGSFAAWLRGLPLKPGKPEVLLYNGEPKGYQGAQHAVVDLDVGTWDLQQCADAIMRLRAEYFYSQEAHDAISFNFTSGDACPWDKWRKGQRPVIRGNSVTWAASARASDSYENFRSYLNKVYTYAGTASLQKELEKVVPVSGIETGDVFIQGGFPGHAILVLDMAVNEEGQKIFLLGQSYMPAQDFHVLVNPNQADMSPWYSADFGEILNTPEWTFEAGDLRRFKK